MFGQVCRRPKYQLHVQDSSNLLYFWGLIECIFELVNEQFSKFVLLSLIILYKRQEIVITK